MKEAVLERMAAWIRQQDWDCIQYDTEGKLMYLIQGKLMYLIQGSREEIDKIYAMISAVASYEVLNSRIDYLEDTEAEVEVYR